MKDEVDSLKAAIDGLKEEEANIQNSLKRCRAAIEQAQNLIIEATAEFWVAYRESPDRVMIIRDVVKAISAQAETVIGNFEFTCHQGVVTVNIRDEASGNVVISERLSIKNSRHQYITMQSGGENKRLFISIKLFMSRDEAIDFLIDGHR